MLNIDTLVLGNQFKSDSGNIYEIKVHLAEGKTINIQLELVVPAEVQDELLT